LNDESAAVIRKAIGGLREMGARISLGDLQNRLLTCNRRQNRWALEGALVLLSRWDSLSLILELAVQNALLRDPDSLIRKWLADSPRKTTTPTYSQLESVVRSFDVVSPQLSEKVRKALTFEIHYARSHLKA
jgi:hypothetical protein